MLKSTNELHGFAIGATDGDLGKVYDAYFDDERWTVRYLVADVGSWLAGRRVLISPHAIARIDSDNETVVTNLTRSAVEKSPPVETDQPVSRLMEDTYNRYYRYPPYWLGDYTTALWGFGALPLAGRAPVPRSTEAMRAPDSGRDLTAVHLRSAREVAGYQVAAADGDIGHVDDFLFDDASWALQYLVIDTRNWWPGRHVLVSPRHVDEVSWVERTVRLAIDRAEVKQSAEYDPRHPPRRPEDVRV